jgi:hypothetical protein
LVIAVGHLASEEQNMSMNQNQGRRFTEDESRSARASDGGKGEYGIDEGATGYRTTDPTGVHTESTGSNDPDFCAHCGHTLDASKGLEQFLGCLGISGDMISNLKGRFENVDIDEYLDTAREYLKDSSHKVTTYTRENPAAVAGGVAALAVGAGLIYAAVNRAGTRKLEDGLRQLELNRALESPMYKLDEVLRELDVTV